MTNLTNSIAILESLQEMTFIKKGTFYIEIEKTPYKIVNNGRTIMEITNLENGNELYHKINMNDLAEFNNFRRDKTDLEIINDKDFWLDGGTRNIKNIYNPFEKQLKGKLKINLKDNLKLSKTHIKKLLKHIDTKVKCNQYLTDDYIGDMESNFGKGEIPRQELLKDYIEIWNNILVLYRKDTNEIDFLLGHASYTATNVNLEINIK